MKRKESSIKNMGLQRNPQMDFLYSPKSGYCRANPGLIFNSDTISRAQNKA